MAASLAGALSLLSRESTGESTGQLLIPNWVMAINAKGVFLGTRVAIPEMRKSARPLSLERPGNQSSQPGLGRGHYLHPHGAGLPVPFGCAQGRLWWSSWTGTAGTCWPGSATSALKLSSCPDLMETSTSQDTTSLILKPTIRGDRPISVRPG